MPIKPIYRVESEVLRYFPQIKDFTLVRYSGEAQKCDTLKIDSLTLLYIRDGRFEWNVSGISMVLLPRDLLMLNSGDWIEQNQGQFESGHYYTINLKAKNLGEQLKRFSGLLPPDQKLVEQLFGHTTPLTIQNFQEGEDKLGRMASELDNRPVGFKSKINLLIDDFFILAAREINRSEINPHDFPKSFEKLDKLLRENLAYSWSVHEMAGVVGLKVTAFTEKIKFYTGFAPIQYLINLRIAEAVRLIKTSDLSMTKIALETGFYSSQHFSTTFKKVTGFSPQNFRKNG
ncbi:AraC family transcriptional regulator [Marinilongibacter aquaticus]|uniref:helix-turn-helix domain-containing protein n=1 Tax=Marinilongibacter aquaticus TaxID=2975157 RepID=UPI0021BD9FE4|nr:AraC family transcriptional regulator [Marinilongibacter aquaticus]UBM57341.1 AraC family transcriptional regulator [Marinilongibacter aquaticus]